MNMTAWMCHSLAIGLLVHGSCLAAPHQGLDEVHTIIVNYSDLDLTRPEGLRVVHERIVVAARWACGPLNGNDSRDLPQYLGYQECVRQAYAQAVRQISSLRPPSPNRSNDIHVPYEVMTSGRTGKIANGQRQE